MRVRALLSKIGLCLVILALCSEPTRAEDWSIDGLLEPTFPWAGFEPGTMVHYRATTDVEVRGREDLSRSQVEETRTTLVEITEAELIFNVEERVDGEWVGRRIRESRTRKGSSTRPTVERAGEESLTIEGKSYACVRRKVADVSDLLDGPKEPGELRSPEDRTSGVVWEHESFGVLKVQSRTPAKGRTATTTLVATKVAVSHLVGETTLACREFTWSTNMVGGKTVRLESTAVPGRTVLTTGDVEQGPVRMSHRKELVGLTIKATPQTEDE